MIGYKEIKSSLTSARQIRAGLQLKAICILSFLIMTTTIGGGWYYFGTTSDCLRRSDKSKALQLSSSISIAVADQLNNSSSNFENIAKQVIQNRSIKYIAILDSNSKIIGSACAAGLSANKFEKIINMPLSVAATIQYSENILALAQPVIINVSSGNPTLVGGLRMVLDTTDTTENLRQVQSDLTLMAGIIICGGIFLGFVLVSRVIVQPVRKLSAAVSNLGKGDYTTRIQMKGNDELADLARAFDGMAEEISLSHKQLTEANEGLEQKVLQRTKDLEVANKRLKQEMQEKEEFLRAVSHDLNAPLRNIAGMATLAMMKYRDQLPEEVVGRLQRIQANVDIQTSMISELLELSRLKTRPETRQLLDLNTIVADIGKLFDHELTTKNIKFSKSCELPTLYVEKNRIRQVFQNLVDNAIKYMDKTPGFIEIRYQNNDNMHRFEFLDNGPGIPSDQWEKVFAIFRRAETEATAKVAGKGVGLALVRAIANNYGGNAYVKSSPPEGSVFYFEISEDSVKEPKAGLESDKNNVEIHDFAGR